MTTIHSEKKALLHVSERNRVRRKRRNDWGWPSASAQGIECVAALEGQQGEQKRAERPQESADSTHTPSYARLPRFEPIFKMPSVVLINPAATVESHPSNRRAGDLALAAG